MNNKKTILVVDDDLINIQLIKNILNSHYSVLTANNGKSAIALAQEYQPDLILLDIIMPGMDGMQVSKVLTKTVSTKDIPVIFLTSKTGEKDQVKAFELGAADYIIKPIRPMIILERVKKQIRLSEKLKKTSSYKKSHEGIYFNFTDQLKNTFSLTESEANLANFLANGFTLEKVSEVTGLKYNTLKGYLKAIFLKTDTRKQHSLVSLMHRTFVT